MNKRTPSPATVAMKAARSGLSVRLVYPDGLTVEMVNPGLSASEGPTRKLELDMQVEEARWDERLRRGKAC